MANGDGRRLRVVYLDHVARLSGGELALLRTLPPLLDRVEAIVVLAEDGPLVGRLRAIGVEVVVLPLADDLRDVHRAGAPAAAVSPRAVWRFLAYVWATARLLRRLDADLVHTNSLKAALYGGLAGRLARVPVVWHVRDRIAPDYLPRRAVVLVRLAARVLPVALVANSRATLATVPTRGRVSAVVPSPVVTPAQQPPVRRDGPFTVGVVGRLAEWKGQHVFLEAFALAFGSEPARARLVGSALFGEEAYEQRLRAQAHRLGVADRVEFRGFRQDVDAELAEMDVVVHCSVLPEPFGQVVVEAMASGRAVVAAAEGGPAEVVTDGEDGVLVAPRDAPLLAKALRRLAEDADLRARLGACGRQTAVAYTPERIADVLMRVYRQVSPGCRG